MSRTSEDPVKHVISFRVNSEEKEALERLAVEYGVSISILMRNSVHSLEDATPGRYLPQLRV